MTIVVSLVKAAEKKKKKSCTKTKEKYTKKVSYY